LFWRETRKVSLLAAGVLGHSLSSLAYGVFGQFTGHKQPDGGLDLARADSRFLVVVRARREASVAMRSKMSLTNEFMMPTALLEIPVSG